MRYISWAVLYEGPSDALYLDVLLPRVIRELIADEGSTLAEIPDAPAVQLGRYGREVDAVAKEACGARDAFEIVFIHADTGGRNLAQNLNSRSGAYCTAMHDRCGLPPERCVTINPRHETEAWLLADDAAVVAALGFRGTPASIGLPSDAREADRLPDPKRVLTQAIEMVAGRRRSQRMETIFPAIAQRQDVGRLRRSPSFKKFEDQLRACLRATGCIDRA